MRPRTTATQNVTERTAIPKHSAAEPSQSVQRGDDADRAVLSIDEHGAEVQFTIVVVICSSMDADSTDWRVREG